MLLLRRWRPRNLWCVADSGRTIVPSYGSRQGHFAEFAVSWAECEKIVAPLAQAREIDVDGILLKIPIDETRIKA